MSRADGETAQMQVLESILVGLFVFVAIALISVQRLPTSPATFQDTKLQNLGEDILKAREGAIPTSSDDCNESPCPFGNDLDRVLGLALGYRGPTIAAGEDPSSTELLRFLDQAVPGGSRYLVVFNNGHNATSLAPLNAVPPAASVVVARTVITPNWTVHAANREAGVILRINDLTGFGTLTSLHDALNRTSTEFAATWLSLFGTRVPNNATYGTYQACTATACRYFTVVPDDVIGAGAQVRTGDRDASGTVRTIGTWAARGKYFEAGGAGFSTADPIYVDVDNSGAVNTGDLRLSVVAGCRATGTTTCYAGSMVRAADADVTRALVVIPATALLKLRSADATTSEGEGVYLDVDVSDSTGAGDIRLTRAGLFSMGSRIVAGDPDIGGSVLLTYTGADVVYNDADGDSAWDEGEGVYLDLEGLGQTTELDPLDVHLTTLGAPATRQAYEVRLVMWYGV